MNDNKLKGVTVSVIMITYGHENYIKQAIEGVLMQECAFDIELIIANDCSPDDTNSVVKQILDNHPRRSRINYTEHKENKGANKNFLWATQQCHGKFIAICEGDDYWIDSLKLQKQVDFLEKNEDYGLVHTQTFFKHFNNDEIKLSSTDRKNNNFKDLIYKNAIATLTTCFKKDLLLKYLEEVKPYEKSWVAGDLPLWLWFSLHSKIYFLDEVTTVYRVVPGSASNTIGSAKYFEFIKSRFSIKEYFIKQYLNDKKLLDYIYNDFYKDAEYHCLKLKNAQVILDLSLNFKTKNSYIKFYYFTLMTKLVRTRNVYEFAFLFYKFYNKYFIKHKKYSL